MSPIVEIKKDVVVVFCTMAMVVAIVRFNENRIPHFQYAQASYKVGWEFEKKNNVYKAVTYYRKAVHHNPGFAQAYYRLGAVYDKLGDSNHKIRAWRQAITYGYRDTPEIFYAVGMDDYTHSDVARAIENFEKALSVQFNYGKVAFALARIYRELGDFDNEIIYWHRTLRAEPTWFWVHMNLGLAYYKKGDMPMAVNHLSWLKQLGQYDLYKELSRIIDREVE